MKAPFAILLICISNSVFSQTNQQKLPPLRWDISVGSGLYLDLFYANLIFGGDNSTPPGYPDKKGRRINPGVTDRIEIKYLLAFK